MCVSFFAVYNFLVITLADRLFFSFLIAAGVLCVRVSLSISRELIVPFPIRLLSCWDLSG